MNNNVLNESFFSSKEVPMCEKTGMSALLLGGTYAQNEPKSFVSFVIIRGKSTPIPVAFDFGRSESLSPMACKTLLHAMGVENVMNIDNIFDGSLSDREIVSKLAELYSTNPNIDKSKFGENFEKLILPKLTDYKEKLKKSDNYLADNPRILESLLETCKEVNSADKKKQLTE